jgi:hypothetical protein
MARPPGLGQEAVGMNNVADVSEIADDLEVTDLYARPVPCFNLGDLECKAG